MRELLSRFRASSYEPCNQASSVNGLNFVVCSYGTFQDEIQETKPNGET